MLEPTVAQRYQTVNAVLTDLNRQQQVALASPTPVTPVSTPPAPQKSTSANSTNDIIDKELQEIKTKLLGVAVVGTQTM